MLLHLPCLKQLQVERSFIVPNPDVGVKLERLHSLILGGVNDENLKDITSMLQANPSCSLEELEI